MGCFVLFSALILAVAFPFLWRAWVEAQTEERIYQAQVAPEKPVAVVFGAAVYRGGRLSPMLRDRMETAIQLYESGKVQTLLLSGDHSPEAEYSEPMYMVRYALERGVPEEAIQRDDGGLRTYDTCYRVKEVFQVEEAILVTQAFHLPRAIYTCQQLGIDAVGVEADLRDYHPRSVGWSRTREVGALLLALVDVVRREPPPVLGEPAPLG